MDVRVEPARDEGGASGEISQVPRQRGLERVGCPRESSMPEPVMTEAPETAEPSETQTSATESASAHPPAAAAIAAGEDAPAPAPLLKTPLHSLHVARGGRMVPFAGYEMPVQYADGIIA